jgi:hypothetical protein
MKAQPDHMDFVMGEAALNVTLIPPFSPSHLYGIT